MVRIPACHAGGRGFKSRPHRRGERKSSSVNFGFLLLFFRYIIPEQSIERQEFINMIAIINGPNLNLLGKREPQIYGKETFESFLPEIRKNFPLEPIEYFQSNSEGEIIDHLHRLGYDNPDCKGIVINPGAYSHYSYAISDAISSIPVPVVEVHISNIMARDEFRHTSVTAPCCKGMLTGFGLYGYVMAVNYLLSLNS